MTAIYKKALENIKENYPLVSPTNYKLIKESFDLLEHLVEQAQKQEELIISYQKIYKDLDDLKLMISIINRKKQRRKNNEKSKE